MVYKLANGYRVRTTHTADGTDFETKNASGETISTVHLKGEEAANMRASLMVMDGIRFGQQYGGTVR